jgi:hypothetical protein
MEINKYILLSTLNQRPGHAAVLFGCCCAVNEIRVMEGK